MTAPLFPTIVFPGAKGRAPEMDLFRVDSSDPTQFETISYPRWQLCVGQDVSAETLIADLATQITAKFPRGPIRIIGISIGGHFGYATALRLQAHGRAIAGFCAIDSFMVASSAASAGWMWRALSRGWELLRNRRFSAFVSFVRSLIWRALFRIAGDRLPRLLRTRRFSNQLSSRAAHNGIFDDELSMRLLIRGTATWIGSLDLKPTPLNAPAILLRTRENAGDDLAWRRRCPSIEIVEIPGEHHTISEPENVDAFRGAFTHAMRKLCAPATAEA